MAGRKQERPLGATLGNVLILLLLGECQVVSLLKKARSIHFVHLLITRFDDSNASPCNIMEAAMETVETTAHNEIHGVRHLRVQVLVRVCEESAIKAVGHSHRHGVDRGVTICCVLEEVGHAHVGVETQKTVKQNHACSFILDCESNLIS